MAEPAIQYITLREAADLYPIKSINTLRRERDRGNLICYRIGNVDYTTHENIRKMFEKCRVKPSLQDCSSENEKAGNRSMSSSTRDVNVAQVSALNAAKKLKNA